MKAQSKGHRSVLRETIHPKVYEIFHPEEKKNCLDWVLERMSEITQRPAKKALTV